MLVDTINFVEEMMSEMIEQEASLLNLWPTLKPLNGQHNESQLNFQVRTEIFPELKVNNYWIGDLNHQPH